jgi:hypothetical protein
MTTVKTVIEDNHGNAIGQMVITSEGVMSGELFEGSFLQNFVSLSRVGFIHGVMMELMHGEPKSRVH